MYLNPGDDWVDAFTTEVRLIVKLSRDNGNSNPNRRGSEVHIMKTSHLGFFMFLTLFLLAISLTTAEMSSVWAGDFVPTPSEKQALESLMDSPVRLGYSYEVVYAKLPDGSHGGMIAPFVDFLEKRLGLNVETKKLDWQTAFDQLKSGEIDFYGPIGLTDQRRKDFLTIDPIFRADAEIVTRVRDPLGMLVNLTNKKIGLLNGSIMQKPLSAYLPPDGKVVHYPTMDAMMQGLEKEEIYCYATVDNAELETLRRPTINTEQLVPNFYIYQGFIGKNEKWKPLVEIVNRFLRTAEGQKIIPAVREAKRKELIRVEQERFADDIAAIRKKYKVVKIFDTGAMYPLSFVENGKREGLLAEIHALFHELTGVPLEPLDWEQFEGHQQSGTQLLQSDQCQFVTSQYNRLEHWNNKELAYSAPIWKDVIRAYTYGPTDKEFRTMKVGSTPNAVVFFNWDLLLGREPEIFETRPGLLAALKQKKIDIAFISEMSFNYHYSILKDYNLRAYGDVSAIAYLRYLYNAMNPELNRLMDEAIRLHQTRNPHSRVEWAFKAEKFKTDVIRLHDFQRKIYLGVALGSIVLISVILWIMYQFAKYDRQVRALILKQLTFDLVWGDTKKRIFMSKGDHPFFRKWGVNFSGPNCSMDEVSRAFGRDIHADYAACMERMKNENIPYIITDHKLVSPKDGSEMHYRRFLHRLNDTQFMLCLQDITEQHEAEKQERLLTELFNAMRVGMFLLDREMNVLRSNDAMKRIFPGFRPDEKFNVAHFCGRDALCPICPVKRTLADGKRHEQTEYLETIKCWIELSSYPIVDPQSGEVGRVLGFVRDVTEQRNWENTLQERDTFLTAILEASNDGIIAFSDGEGVNHVNSRFCTMFGGTPESLRHNTATQMIELHDRVALNANEIDDARQKCMQTGELQEGILYLRDGRIYEWRVAPSRIGVGDHLKNMRIWTYHDATDRFRAAEAIQQSEIKFRTLFNASPSGLGLFAPVPGPDGETVDFRFVDVNPALEKINRLPKAEQIGRCLMEFFPHIKINSGDMEGVSLLAPCLLAMEGKPGVYSSHNEMNDTYQQLTIFGTATGQLAIFVTDDTDRVNDERSLRTIHAVIEYMSEPVIWVDKKGFIRYTNEAGSEFFGYAHSDPPLGINIWEFDKSVTPENWKMFLGRMDTDGTLRFETVMQRKDGTKFPAHVVSDKIELEGETLIAACFRDLSEQVRRIEAEQTALAKSRFLDHMSHEIRTPLNGMIGMTTLLAETELTPKQKGYVDLSRSAGRQLLSIVNGILDFSDINAKKIVLHPARFDFSGLVHSAIAEATEKLDEKDTEGQIEFRVKYATVVPRYLVGDMERLEQIFLAMLDNAVKFTERGTISLVVSDDGHESRNVGTPCILRVEVVDTGVGISEEKMQQLFESFTLGDASFSRKYGGTGLGLVVTKNLIELMGGNVYAESKADTGKEGGGSRFWFTIPLPIDGNAYLEAKEWTVVRKVLPKPSEVPSPQSPAVPVKLEAEVPNDDPVILVVEDNKINRIVVGEILKNAGFCYDFAENGRIACDAVASKKFSLILMDCQMPIMDGFEATRTIRKMEAGTDEKKPGHSGHIPIIALTANALKGDEEACRQSGMDAFCGKPTETPKLLAAIRDWLR